MGRSGSNGNEQTTGKNLTSYLADLVRAGHFRNHSEIAEEIGVDASTLRHILTRSNRRLSVGQCLRLARKAGEDPSVVLREASREDDAAVLDDLWPTKTDLVHLTRKEREHLKKWRQITVRDRQTIEAMINVCVELITARTAGRMSRKRASGRTAKQAGRS